MRRSPPYLRQWRPASKLKGEFLQTADSVIAAADGGTTPEVHDGWMWDLTVPGNNDHDFYVLPAGNDPDGYYHVDETGVTAVLVHNCNTNDGLADLPIHSDPTKFYVKAGELVDNRIASHPLTEDQLYGGDTVGHDGVVNLSNDELMMPGGPNGDDPISGYREFAPGDTTQYPGSEVHITAGHHRTFLIAQGVLSGEIDPETLMEFAIRK